MDGEIPNEPFMAGEDEKLLHVTLHPKGGDPNLSP